MGLVYMALLGRCLFRGMHRTAAEKGFTACCTEQLAAEMEGSWRSGARTDVHAVGQCEGHRLACYTVGEGLGTMPALSYCPAPVLLCEPSRILACSVLMLLTVMCLCSEPGVRTDRKSYVYGC